MHFRHMQFFFLYFLERPSVPQLTVNNGEDYSVYFLCASEGNPQPTIMWYENEKRIR